MIVTTWCFPVLIASAVDGDSVKVELDCGFGLYRRCDVRLWGVDCAETRGGEEWSKTLGDIARNRTAVWLDDHLPSMVLRSIELDSFGRVIGDLYGVDDDGRVVSSLSDVLLEERLAIPYDGGPRRPHRHAECAIHHGISLET